MKFYPDEDVWFYVDKPSCMNSYQKYPKSHNWKLYDRSSSRVMMYWRDIEGSKMADVKRKDLYFTNWPKNRIRPQACLGMLYATGHRFIRLAQAEPSGFKCAPLPVNLAQARQIKVELRKKRKREMKAAKKAKKEAKKAKKNTDKGKGKGGKGGQGGTQSKVITYKNVDK
ncbi:uncharacterized protein Dwil_GK15977 [Drosophila willistoni]|uniref:Uncharacterized protein n=1 Tax=Drosophila willistoni TaxID=7260 RepID=B4MSA6_DROWI|nr:uncharacterized protein LOC124459858 [Drosophila willistoni]EDW74995.1 uncharacterized protein Dwil_GK15977 [Drosophila willistoni]